MGLKKKQRKKKTDTSVDKKETENPGVDTQPVETTETVPVESAEKVPIETTETSSTDEVFMEKPVMELYSRKEKGFYGPKPLSSYGFVIFSVLLVFLLIFSSFMWGGVGDSFVEFESHIFLGVFFGWLIVSAFTFRGFAKQREAPILLMGLAFLSLSFFILVESMTVSDPVFNVFEGLSDSDIEGIKTLLGVLSVFCALSALKISLSRH